MEEVIITKNLTRRYFRKEVLKDVNISIRKGEIYGIVGNNGAGKSTLLKIICGLVKPTEGSVEFPETKENAPRVGTLIENPGLYFDMNAFDNVKAKALCMGVKYAPEDIEDLLCLVGLDDAEGKRVRAFSMGMKQRLGLALALVGEPDVLILDEPINGLDPQGINEIRKVLTEIHEKRGITMLISSHILDELVKVATRFCVLDRGKIIKECTKEEFVAECGERDIDEYYIELIESSRKRAF